MKTTTRLTLASLTLLACASLASAQITPIGSPFTGQISETWETFSAGSGLANGSAIFGGAATITGVSMVTPQNGGWTMFDNGNTVASDGTKFFGEDVNSGPTTITFVVPQNSFGAFWGRSRNAGNPGTTIELQFFDAGGSQIGANQTFTYTRPGDGILEWHGFNSTTPIKDVRIINTFEVVMDGLQASAAPEPGTLALLAIGGLALLKRSRRR